MFDTASNLASASLHQSHPFSSTPLMSSILLFSPSNLKKFSSFFIGILLQCWTFFSNKLCPCLLSCSMMGHLHLSVHLFHLLYSPSCNPIMPWGLHDSALFKFSVALTLSDFTNNPVLLQFLFGLSVWAERTLCFPDGPFSLLSTCSPSPSLGSLLPPTFYRRWKPPQDLTLTFHYLQYSVYMNVNCYFCLQ